MQIRFQPFILITPKTSSHSYYAMRIILNLQHCLFADGVLTHFIKDSWEELLSSCGKREETGDVGEHTGHNEWVIGFIVQHGLQQPHALVYGEFLQR